MLLGQRAQGGLGVPRGAPQGECLHFPTADLTGRGSSCLKEGSYSVMWHIPVDTWGEWTPGPHSYLDDFPTPALGRCPLSNTSPVEGEGERGAEMVSHRVLDLCWLLPLPPLPRICPGHKMTLEGQALKTRGGRDRGLCLPPPPNPDHGATKHQTQFSSSQRGILFFPHQQLSSGANSDFFFFF